MIDGAKPADPSTSTSAVLFIALVALISIWTATCRPAGLDIIEILRIE